MGKIVAEYVARRDTKKGISEQKEDDNNIKPKTLFHSIEQSALPPHEKIPLRLVHEGLTVLFAGAETGARLLTHTFYHLLDNPDVLKNVKNEIDNAIGESSKLPDVKVLEGLPWLVSLGPLASFETCLSNWRRLGCISS